jgi:ApaG protein
MSTLITDGVKISVETFYQQPVMARSSSGMASNFTYQITIENLRSTSIQLLQRHWIIFDTNFSFREVRGDGVVGEQPILEPGEVYRYISGCQLTSEIGSMHGEYTMQCLEDGSTLEVLIPRFTLVAIYRLN